MMLTASFKQFFKQFRSTFINMTSALEVNFNVMRFINSPFTYLLYLYGYEPKSQKVI